MVEAQPLHWLTRPGNERWLLPAELLPAPWIGERAVRLFHDRHGRWEPAAIHEWERISQEAS